MADVFISYAHEDRSLVRELVHHLSRAGFTVWWDRELSVGAELAAIIERELEQASCVIVVWSKASVRSNWVISESNAALDAGNLIPMLVDDAKIPLPFRVRETANMQGWPSQNQDLQLQKLLFSVKAQITGKPLDEAQARAVNDQHDPTMSIRIANRVTEALQHSSSGADVEVLALRLEFETTLANFGVALVNGEVSRSLATNFLDLLAALLRTSYINVWHGSNQIYGFDSRGRTVTNALEAQSVLYFDIDTHSAESDEFLTSQGLNWAYMYAGYGSQIALGSIYSDSPPVQVINRLELACRLLAKHEHALAQIGPSL